MRRFRMTGLRPLSFAAAAALLLALSACGDGKESTNRAGASATGAEPSAAAGAGSSGAGPDTSGLARIVLARINEDPTRQELKVTGQMVEFRIASTEPATFGDVANAVVECEGTVVFDGDVPWNWQSSGPKKAGEVAKFECQVEYVNQGSGWQIFGPIGIYPI